MDYFNHFGFTKEPFSSSQGPEYLFQSRQYINTLEKLQESVINRHGMTVVLGQEGAGKTMLCQGLLTELRDNDSTDALLIRGSTIGSDINFAGNISKLFGKYVQTDERDDPESKEKIKEYIFKQCVSEKKTGVIIIDDGHKLPESCLHFLEECFKYHIDAHKLLQIVIFGKPQLKKHLGTFKDLSTWVHSYHTIGPLNFKETKELISLRISRASDTNVSLSLFSFPALWSIFQTTNGYPGKIVDFCQILLLTMAIHNYSKADWYITQHCSKIIYPEHTKKIQKKRFGMITGVMAAIIIYSFTMNQSDIMKLPKNLTQKQPIVTKVPTPPPIPITPEKQVPISNPIPTQKIAKQPHETVEKPVVKQTAAIAPPSPDITSSTKVPTSTDINAEKKKILPVKETAMETRPEKIIPNPPITIAEKQTPTKSSDIEKKFLSLDKKATVDANTEKTTQIIKTSLPANASPVTSAAVEVQKSQKLAPITATESKPTRLYGKITIRKKETLGDLISTVYGKGSFTKINTASVMKANPHISNPSQIAIGETIRFPAIPINISQETDKNWWVQLASFDRLEDAYRFLRSHTNATTATRIFTSKNGNNAQKFNIVMDNSFTNENNAQKARKKLSSKIFPDALVLSTIDQTTFQYFMPKIAVTPETAHQPKVSTSKTTSELKPTMESKTPSMALLESGNKNQPVAARPALPQSLGKITVRKGENLGDMIRKTYGPYSFNPKNTAIVLKNNPHIKNPGKISVGDTFHFPVMPVSLTPDAEKVWWLQYALVERLDEAYRFLSRYFANTAPMLIIPTWNNRGELRFSILKQEYFKNEKAAREALRDLSQSNFPNAKYIAGLNDNQFYYKLKAKETDRF